MIKQTHGAKRVISDLHLGGAAPQMMSRPRELADFIERLKNIAYENETMELVIAGDFVDFLVIEPTAGFTPDTNMAKNKLLQTIRRHSISYLRHLDIF